MAAENDIIRLPAIQAKELCFKYTIDSNARRALTNDEIERAPLILSGLTFNLDLGNRVLLCGANGAGKSTLLEILAGRKRPTNGVLTVLGKPAFDSSLSCVLMTASWADDISKLASLPVLDLLQSSIKTAMARCPNLADPQEVEAYQEGIQRRGLALATLLEVDAAWITTELSEGQKRRVQLASHLVYPSEVVLLDEVTAELDILTRRRLLNFLAKDCADRNATLIYCTHVFDGLSGFINTVMQLSKGELHPLAPSLKGGGSVHSKVLSWLSSSSPNAASAEEDRFFLARAILGLEKAQENSNSSPNEEDAVLSVSNFTWGYHGASAPIFKQANFALKPGSRCILTGSNGCGKTTLLSILGGGRIPVGFDDDNTKATIRCVGVDPIKNHAVINREVVHVSSAWRSRIRSIVNGGAELCVAELSSGIIKHATRSVLTQTETVQSSERISEQAVSEVIARRFEYLKKLLSVGDEWVMSRVSSGQRARVQLCLQLLHPSKVILMDEVTAELDVDTRHKLFKFLKEESEGPMKVCVLYATHVLEGLDDWFSHILHLRKPRPWDSDAAIPHNCLLLTKQNGLEMLEGAANHVDDDTHESDAGLLFRICLTLLLKERDDDLNQNVEEVTSFPSTGPLLRAKADARILTRSDADKDARQQVPKGWSYRTNRLPGGRGSHTWGIEEAEDLPSRSIADEAYLPAALPLPKAVVSPPQPAAAPEKVSPPPTSANKPAEQEEVKSTVSPLVLLPVLSKLEESIGDLKTALLAEDLEAIAASTQSTSLMWNMMEPALSKYTGKPRQATSSSPFGSGPRTNAMPESALVAQGAVLGQNS